MNKLVRLQQPGPNVPAPGTRSNGWVWDGNQWTCGPCDDGSAPPFPFCPPPGFPPPGCPPWFSGMNSPPWYPGANAGVSFGTMPPQNPVRGHFWWDGATLWLFDGAAWDPIGGAQSGGTTPPSTTAPANPQPGQQWFNGTTLFVWDGNAWVPVSQTKTSIQATAPPAPHPGDLWYDGTQLHIWDGSAWELVGPGATVGPVPTTTLTFQIQQPVSLVMPGGSAWGIVPYAAVPLVDTQTAWDSVSHKITPKKAGFYVINVRAGTNSGTGGVAILKNDPGTFTNVVGTSDLILANGSGANGAWMSLTGFGQMNGTTDFWRVWGWSPDAEFYPVGSSPAVSAILLP